MQEIPGKRANTSRYLHDGYEYHIDTTSPNIFRCSRRATTGCRGTARVDDQGDVIVYQPHEGHGRNETILEESRVRVEMLDLSTRTNTPLKEIFDDVCRRNPLVAPKFSFTKMRSAMQRARAKIRPVIPESLRELAQILENYEPTQQVFRGIVEANDGSVALMFASDQMLEALGECTEIYVDGTFKVAPYHPPIVQLYTIHMRVMDTGIAAVYVLCGARTRALYSAIFTRLCDLVPGMAGNLRFIMGDYERAAMGALREVFPEASLHGCWFHFNQALVRQWRSLGLANARATILSLSMAFALAPADRFNEGLGLLAEMADLLAIEHPAILRFMAYMRRQWSPLAEVVSVHGCPSRTNNLVESFHNEAKRKLGGLHPNIWKFLEHLTDLIGSQGMDLVRLREGGRARRARNLRNINRDALIRDAQHDLSVGRYTLMDFLTRCATRTADLHPERFDVLEEEAAEVEAALVQPGVMVAGEPRVDGRVPRGARRGRGVRPGNRAAGAGRGDRNPVLPQPDPVNRGRGAVARPREPEAADPAEAAAPAPEIPAARDERLEPGIRPVERLAVEPIEVADIVEGADRDIFHLPEDDLPIFQLPEEPIPFHPVEPLPEGERNNPEAERPADMHCVVCLIAPRTHAFIPCGHLVCCAACADRIAVRCPFCQTASLGVFRIWADV